MAIKIDKAALEQACKEIIQTILFILPNAHKGTVYRIGGPPTMVARRITSGVIDEKRERISWGLPERSDYNPPGKPWEEYMDRADRPLEAMAWCVEKQKSWTAENPSRDMRSVRMQVEGVREDYHHMEPVLIRKEDLYLGNGSQAEYPCNIKGEQIWSHSDYVVIAVIKIHFTLYTIKIGSPETRIIKRLSRALGTELLSYQLREQSFEAMRHLAEDKINSCNILADSLRNLITKSGLIFSLIKLEMGSLRARWEGLLLRNSDQRKMKLEAIHALNNILWEINEPSSSVVRDLVEQQNKLLDLYLPPERGENWVKMQIEERWNSLIEKGVLNREQVSEVYKRICELKRSLYLGRDPELLDRYDVIPEPLGQIVHCDHLVGTENHHPFNDIFQFADISRPAVSIEKPFHFGIHPLDRYAEFAFVAILVDEVIHQQPDVFLTALEWRQSDMDHIQAVIKIFSEAALLHFIFQDFIGGGNHANIHCNGPYAADALKILFL